jgi:hypothetical protein
MLVLKLAGSAKNRIRFPHVVLTWGMTKNFYNQVAEMSKRNPLQAFNAQLLDAHGSREGVYGKELVERVKYNTQCSIKGVRRIIRKRGDLAESVKEISAPKPVVEKKERRNSGKRIKASKSGSLSATSYTLKDGWLLEPVSDGKLPVYYR